MNANSSSFGCRCSKNVSPKRAQVDVAAELRAQRRAELRDELRLGQSAGLELEQRVDAAVLRGRARERGAERLERDAALLLQRRGTRRAAASSARRRSRRRSPRCGSCASQHVVAADARGGPPCASWKNAQSRRRRPRSSVVPQTASPAARCGYGALRRRRSHSSRLGAPLAARRASSVVDSSGSAIARDRLGCSSRHALDGLVGVAGRAVAGGRSRARRRGRRRTRPRRCARARSAPSRARPTGGRAGRGSRPAQRSLAARARCR